MNEFIVFFAGSPLAPIAEKILLFGCGGSAAATK